MEFIKRDERVTHAVAQKMPDTKTKKPAVKRAQKYFTALRAGGSRK